LSAFVRFSCARAHWWCNDYPPRFRLHRHRVHGNAAAWERTTRQLKHTWDLLKEATDKKNSGQTGVTTSQCSANHRFLSKCFDYTSNSWNVVEKHVTIQNPFGRYKCIRLATRHVFCHVMCDCVVSLERHAPISAAIWRIPYAHLYRRIYGSLSEFSVSTWPACPYSPSWRSCGVHRPLFAESYE
jgi:hypothetical protein